MAALVVLFVAQALLGALALFALQRIILFICRRVLATRREEDADGMLTPDRTDDERPMRR